MISPPAMRPRTNRKSGRDQRRRSGRSIKTDRHLTVWLEVGPTIGRSYHAGDSFV